MWCKSIEEIAASGIDNLSLAVLLFSQWTRSPLINHLAFILWPG